MIHQNSVGSETPGKAQIMDYGENGAAGLLQPRLDQGKDLLLIIQVKMVCRLIQDQHPRILGENLGQEDALGFTTGKGQHAGMPKGGQAGHFQGVFDLLFLPGIRSGKEAGLISISPQRDDFFHGIGISDVILLGQDADIPRKLSRLQGTEFPAVPQKTAGTGDALGNGLNERGFSGPVRADQHEPLPFIQTEGQIIDDGIDAIPDGDMFALQHSCYLRFPVL